MKSTRFMIVFLLLQHFTISYANVHWLHIFVFCLINSCPIYLFLRNLNVKKNPELNFKALVEMNHNYKHSEFDADINYGPDFKDTNRSIEMSAQLNRDIKGWASASADGSLNFKHVGQVCSRRKTIT